MDKQLLEVLIEGLSDKERIQEIKHLKVLTLYYEAVKYPPELEDFLLEKYFDLESKAMLEEKIEVLTALKNGLTIKDIPNLYSVLERYPNNLTSGIKFD